TSAACGSRTPRGEFRWTPRRQFGHDLGASTSRRIRSPVGMCAHPTMNVSRPADSFVDLQSPPELPAPDTPPPLGRIGPYLLLGKLGQGGMGAVYRAVHDHLKWTVALKTLAAERIIDPHAIARFRREAEVVARLDHPNVVRAKDAGVDAG